MSVKTTGGPPRDLGPMDLPTLFSPLFRLALLLIMLSSGLVARAQYGIDHWTVEDGLPQGIIRGIAQTPDGYLWITTLDGLARFDGVHFTIFNKSNTSGISSNRFGSMYQ